MKKIYYKEGEVKFYALTIAKSGCIISSTKDAARARIHSDGVFRDCDEYYKMVARKDKAAAENKGVEGKTSLQRTLVVYQEE